MPSVLQSTMSSRVGTVVLPTKHRMEKPGKMNNTNTNSQAFFCTFGPKLRSDENSGFHQNSDNFFCKTQVFEAFAGRSVNKGFPKLRKSCQNSGQKPQNSGFWITLTLKCFKKPHKKKPGVVYLLCCWWHDAILMLKCKKKSDICSPGFWYNFMNIAC